jgi:hypothetical protein
MTKSSRLFFLERKRRALSPTRNGLAIRERARKGILISKFGNHSDYFSAAFFRPVRNACLQPKNVTRLPTANSYINRRLSFLFPILSFFPSLTITAPAKKETMDSSAFSLVCVHNLALLALSLIVFYVVLSAIYQLTFSPLSHLPGPWYAAVSDFWLTTHVLRLQQCKTVQDLFDTYGPVVRVGPNKVVFRDISTMRSVYSVHKFDKSPYYKSLLTCVTLFLMPLDALTDSETRSQVTIMTMRECLTECILIRAID